MNYRQRRFVVEYMIDADRTAAAIRAGYRPSSARAFGYKLMQDVQVQYAVALRQEERAARTGVTRERVLQEYVRLAFANFGRVAQWGATGLRLAAMTDLSDDDAAAIAELACDKAGRIGVRLHDKDFALTALARHFGLDRKSPAADQRGAHERLMALVDRYAAQAARAARAAQAEIATPRPGPVPAPR